MLDSLRHFLLVAEHGSFTQAARRAGLSQPALTASIRRLEETLEIRVLERGRFGARLTPAGSQLIPHARAGIVAIEEGLRSMRALVHLEAGRVTLGAGSTACTYHLPQSLLQFRRRYPHILLVLRELPEADAIAALERGELDIAIVGQKDGELFRNEEIVLVKAPGGKERLLPFLTLPRGTATRELLEELFPHAEVAMEISSVSTIKGAVRAGLGVALISKSAVATDLELGRLALVADPRTPIPRPLRLVHRGLDRLTPAARAMRALLLADAPRSQPRTGRETRRQRQ